MGFHGRRSGSAAADVAHAWAHQTKDSWSKNNVSFDGKIIYSYGRHFPMAALLGDGAVLITTASYSNTTARHQRIMESAVSHMVEVYAYHVPDYSFDEFPESYHRKNIDYWIKKVRDKFGEVGTAKQKRTKDRLTGEIEPIRNQARAYINHFHITLSDADTQSLFKETFDGYQEACLRAWEEQKQKKAELIKKGKELHPAWLEAWRNGSEWEFNQEHGWDVQRQVQLVEHDDNNRNKVRLRVFDGHVYTSKQVKIPVDIAHRYYRKYLAVVAKGGCSETCNYKMLEFEVKEMNADHLLVGCHDIARSEIDYIAEKLGWVK